MSSAGWFALLSCQMSWRQARLMLPVRWAWSWIGRGQQCCERKAKRGGLGFGKIGHELVCEVEGILDQLD